MSLPARSRQLCCPSPPPNPASQPVIILTVLELVQYCFCDGSLQPAKQAVRAPPPELAAANRGPIALALKAAAASSISRRWKPQPDRVLRMRRNVRPPSAGPPAEAWFKACSRVAGRPCLRAPKALEEPLFSREPMEPTRDPCGIIEHAR